MRKKNKRDVRRTNYTKEKTKSRGHIQTIDKKWDTEGGDS